MVPFQWLRPQDTTLWCAETEDAPLQVGALCLFEGPPLRDSHGRVRVADLRQHGRAALVNVPRLRQIMVTPPLGVGRPAWVDDPHFDPDRHLRAATLPAPGDRDALRRFVRDVLETPLESGRPPWEFWIVDGVAGDRVAVVLRFSHLAVDGIALLTYALSLLDDHPRTAPRQPAETWHPAPAPGTSELLAAALVDDTRRRLTTLGAVAAAIGRPDRLVGRTVRLVRAGHGMLTIAQRLPITGAVGRGRDFAWVSLPLDGLRAGAHARGVTLNDVVLALVAEALARAMTPAGTRRDGRQARVLVPVSTHVSDSGMSNAFSLLVSDLPLGEMTLTARVAAVHAATARARAAGQVDLGSMLWRIESVVPPSLLRVVAPPLLRHQPFVNLAVTNLAGSRVPLYLLGSRMLEVYPFITLTGNIGLIVGVLSHEDRLGVSVTTDPQLGLDVERFVHDVAAAAEAFVGAR